MKRKSSLLAGNKVASRDHLPLPISKGNFWLVLPLIFLLLFPHLLQGQPVPILARGPDEIPVLVPDGGFETPDVTGFQQNPSGGAWTFNGISGLSDNGTAVTSANPNAPEGQQVAYISRTADIQNSIDVPAGFYQFSFKAAQSGLNPGGDQSLELIVDGQSVETFTPNGTSYLAYSSDPVFLSSGLHSISLKGKARNATALVDEFAQQWTRYKNVVPPPSGPPYVAQLLYLFPNAQGSLNLNIKGNGYYRIVFNGQKGSGGGQPELRVSIGQEEVGEFKIGPGSAPDTTLCMRLSAGNYSLKFKNLSSSTAIQVTQVRAEYIGDWHDPYAWQGNQVPGPSDFAKVPANVAIALNGSMNPEFLTSNGELLAAQNEGVDLSSKHILLDGPAAKLEMGREKTPYLENAVFTLNATIQDTIVFKLPMGAKFIAAKGGALWDMHGKPKHSWTRLSATAEADSSEIQLSDSVDWEVGDSIVIASTDYDPHQAEVFSIAGISADGKKVTLNGSLAYMHYGLIDSFYNGVRHYEMDERAEVGLLSRNIVIQGDANSATSLYGAHTMSMIGSRSYVENVEFFRCGQAGILAKYPFHWHQAQDVSGQYIKNASIHRSYNRVVTVHSSDSALVEGVVGLDHFGHGFYLESGDEEGNTFKNNLGILTRIPVGFIPVEPHDSVPDEEGGLLFKLPATFWITNPSNNYIGNAAAGSEGAGFWMVALAQPLQGTTAGPPAFLPLGTFTNNSAHSGSWSNFSIDGGIDFNTHEFIKGTYLPKVNGQPHVPVIEGLTCYRSRRRGVWIRASRMIFEDCAFSEMPIMVLFAFNQVLNNSLLCGQSSNIGNPQSPSEMAAGRSLPKPNQQPLGAGNRIYGYNIYDGPSEYRKVHFAGFEMANTWGMQPVGAATKSTVHRVEELSFEDSIPESRKVNFFQKTTDDHIYSTGVIDLDGSLTDTAGIRITPRILDPMNPNRFWQVYEDGFNHEPSASFKPEWNAWFTDEEHYALHRMENGWQEGTGASLYAYRSDGPALYTPAPKGKNNQNAVMVNKPSQYQYRWQYHRLSNQIKTFIRFCNQNDQLVSRIEHVPSTTRLYYGNGSSPTLANDLTDLLSSGSEKYLILDNTLYINHVATNGGTDPLYGDLYSHRSPDIYVCQHNNCSIPSGRTDFMTLADFEIGSDGRFSTGGSLSILPPTFDAPQDPFQGGDNSMFWTVQTDGNGIDDSVDIKLALPRTITSEFKTLQLNYSGGPLAVLVHDIDQGYLSIDTVNPGPTANADLRQGTDPSNWVYFDQVDTVIFRIKESFLGDLNSVHTANFQVKEMRLYDEYQAGGTKMNAGTDTDSGEIHDQAAQLTIYPNPSNGRFSLSTWLAASEQVEIQILDMQGRRVFQATELAPVGRWEKDIDLVAKGIPNGIYQMFFHSHSTGSKAVKLSLQR